MPARPQTTTITTTVVVAASARPLSPQVSALPVLAIVSTVNGFKLNLDFLKRKRDLILLYLNLGAEIGLR